MLKLAILAALNSLPIYKEDQGKTELKAAQFETLSTALAQSVDEHRNAWIGSPEQLAGVTLTVGYAESGYSLRIQAGDCYAWECDRGRARGLFQMHQSAVQGQHPILWIALPGLDVGSVELSVDQVVRALIRSRKQCGSLERRGKDWLPMTLSAYAGRGCIGGFRGLDERVRTFKRIESVLLARPLQRPAT